MSWAAKDDWGSLAVHGFAALAGATLPQLGACVRARWSWVLEEPRQVQTAYAFESVVDEVVFVTGPTLVTFLATAWHPVAGLAVAGLTGLVGAITLAAQRGTHPPARWAGSRTDARARPPLPWPAVVPPAVALLAPRP